MASVNGGHSLSAKARRLVVEIDQLISHADDLRQKLEPAIGATHPDYRNSIRNLVHYLAIRQTDLRDLQTELAEIGLSSLGRLESCVLPTLESVSGVLHRLSNVGAPVPRGQEAPVAIAEGSGLLKLHSDAFFGPGPVDRQVRIMVTLPSEAADDPEFVSSLVAAGMDVARINTAHDDLRSWLRMIDHVRSAREQHNRHVQIEADLAGPKLRTGPLEDGPRVHKYRPQRGPRGEVLARTRVKLVPSGTEYPERELPMDAGLLNDVGTGDVLAIRDTRDRWRRYPVGGDGNDDLHIEVDRALYAETGAAVVLERVGKRLGKGRVGQMPAQEVPLRLHVGDTLILSRDPAPGRNTLRDGEGDISSPATIPCIPSVALNNVTAGHSVWFDDGRIGGRVVSVDSLGATVEITQATANGANLRPEKGINFPDTDIDLPAMSEADLAALTALIDHVDLIGLSFVRHPSDVVLLQEHLQRLGASDTGIVLKIETRDGFANLPLILLTAARSPRVAVMVARGDLAVEIGFERLAEVQEEILWLCEAAHLPVIWATQVLEAMAKSGAPSRAEVTDAAMAERAECVMLNKGPYIVPAVSMLADVLRRMEAHQYKKRSMLRSLSVSHQPWPSAAPDRAKFSPRQRMF